MTPTIKKLTEAIPFVTVLTILLGYLNFHTYYIFFDINIFSFLDTSEIILSFGAFVFPLIIFFFIYALAGIAAPTESFYYLFKQTHYVPIKRGYLVARVLLIFILLISAYVIL